MLGAVVCWLWGHRRGKRDASAHVLEPGRVAYKCPRCGMGWTRPARPAK